MLAEIFQTSHTKSVYPASDFTSHRNYNKNICSQFLLSLWLVTRLNGLQSEWLALYGIRYFTQGTVSNKTVTLFLASFS